MLELRRVRAGIFSENDSGFVNLYELEKAVEECKKGEEDKLRKILIPAESAIKEVMPDVQVNEKSLKKLYNGSPIFREFLESEMKLGEGERFAAFCRGVFIGVYKTGREGNILARPEVVIKQI